MVEIKLYVHVGLNVTVRTAFALMLTNGLFSMNSDVKRMFDLV